MNICYEHLLSIFILAIEVKIIAVAIFFNPLYAKRPKECRLVFLLIEKEMKCPASE